MRIPIILRLGPPAAGLLGLVLLGTAFVACGLAASTLSENQVVAALVARGVASGRLQAIGSGEGRSWLALADDAPVIGAEVSGMALREVSFRVLVWDDAARPRTVFNED